MNPWLEIDISDYVNHMSSPDVGQYQLINQCFELMLSKYNPSRIFVPGCTIGNGFEYIEWNNIEKVTALDINPAFLKILRNKFPVENKLEIINGDFEDFETGGRLYNLIFAALFFEYVDLKHSLLKLRKMMDNSSVLFSIIQLPDHDQTKVSKTEYKSLEKLESHITLVSADEFEKEIKNAGLIDKFKEQKTLINGKSFILSESAIK